MIFKLNRDNILQQKTVLRIERECNLQNKCALLAYFESKSVHVLSVDRRNACRAAWYCCSAHILVSDDIEHV